MLDRSIMNSAPTPRGESLFQMEKQISEVHPELQYVARRIPNLTMTHRNLWLWRLMDHVLWRRRLPKDIRIENIQIPIQDNQAQIRLRMYRPQSAASPAPILVWLHGGGYIMGTPEQDDPCCIQYARDAGLIVASVDYRYAPTYPFPIPLEDSYAALKWVVAQAAQLGIDAHRIAIGGESAGGGLAAALGQLAHDRNEIEPVFQLLVYPMLDDRTSLRTDLIDHGHYLWNQASNRFGWESYLGKFCGTADLPGYAVPARREDLSGLPPAWIGVGTLDLFHDEDVAYAHRLQDCGVECELIVVSGAFHGFDMATPKLPVVQDFRDSQIAALKRYR